MEGVLASSLARDQTPPLQAWFPWPVLARNVEWDQVFSANGSWTVVAQKGCVKLSVSARYPSVVCVMSDPLGSFISCVLGC